MRPGRRVGVDIGQARVGVAVCDPDGLIATPVESVPRDLSGHKDIDRVAELCVEFEAVEVVVGLPLSLSGVEGSAAGAAREYARRLASRVRPVPIRLVDERLTTVDAHRSLRDAGRGTRTHRSVIDQQSAVLILQTALDIERATNWPAGEQLLSRKPRASRRHN
ncbi:Holliday junction resolvase RuvX [Austwickia chelonae]|uniref:Holliday junction resolvase RuvX n=1 Tax=Austwickia chelonae TaxID=100225 RepID=UPI000E22364F|nr:Holliday junction resolvase RuvX [Austwickia chelonae]